MLGIRANKNIRKNDVVMVMSGKSKGKSGRVLKINPSKNSVIIEKVNFIKKHQRPTSQMKQGGIIEREGPVKLDAVMLVCPKCNKPVRVRVERVQAGDKNRLCIVCKEIIGVKK